MSKQKNDGSYDSSQIQVLEGLEPVRKRPGMYIGSTGYDGIHHLIKEIADNSVDEAIAGYGSRVDVRLLADGGVTVTDNGRGIPVDKHPKTGLSALETVLTVLHAGGKFGGGGYKVSSGLHGVGSSVVNALSTKMIAEVVRDGQLYRVEFERGKIVQPLKKIGNLENSMEKIDYNFFTKLVSSSDLFTRILIILLIDFISFAWTSIICLNTLSEIVKFPI